MKVKAVFQGMAGISLLVGATCSSAAVIWDESINGDLFLNEFALSAGTSTLNIVERAGFSNGSFLANAPFGDVENGDDRFRVSIADGFEITGVSISINSFDIVRDEANSLIENRVSIFINEFPSFAAELAAQSDAVSTASLAGTVLPVEMFSDSGLNLGAGVHQFQTTSLLSSFNSGNADWEVVSEYSVNIDVAAVSAVPVPAAAWLFASALLGLIGIAKRKV